MIKIYLKLTLQKLLGFENYLYIFSLFTIYLHRIRVRESDFKHFLNMIQENGNILDIGSNIGIMAVPLAKRASAGRVFCFEPIPRHIHILKKVIRHYNLSNIKIYETALGEENGELTMVMPELNHVKLQGYSHVVEKETDKKKGDLFIVPAQKLDDIPDLQKLMKIHAIKIDVENFEYKVFKGAEVLLRVHKPLIYCELWDNDKRLLTINYLKNNFGYTVRVFENHEWVDFNFQQSSNFLFMPQSESPNY